LLFFVVIVVVNASASNCLERLVFEMTCNVDIKLFTFLLIYLLTSCSFISVLSQESKRCIVQCPKILIIIDAIQCFDAVDWNVIYRL